MLLSTPNTLFKINTTSNLPKQACIYLFSFRESSIIPTFVRRDIDHGCFFVVVFFSIKTEIYEIVPSG